MKSFKRVTPLPLSEELTKAINRMIQNMYTPTGRLKKKYR